MADAQAVTRALGGRWHGGYGTAPCPAHDDRHPSLSLRDGHTGRLLVCCHAGCGWRDIKNALRAMGLLPGRGEPPAPPDPAVRAAREREEREEAARRARQARWCWRGTQRLAGTPAERYLRGRGIAGPLPSSLRFHPACWHAPTARRLPALVARVDGTAGAGFAVHRTYLTPEGRKIAPPEDARRMLGATEGGAARLARGQGPLVVAEGIETALSVAERPGLVLPGGERPPSVWAALSAGGLAALRLPDRPGRLVIAADGDAAGREAAEALAVRALEAGWRVAVRPAPEGRDWNDALREMPGEAARAEA